MRFCFWGELVERKGSEWFVLFGGSCWRLEETRGRSIEGRLKGCGPSGLADTDNCWGNKKLVCEDKITQETCCVKNKITSFL